MMDKSAKIILQNSKVSLFIIVILFGYSLFLSLSLVLIVSNPDDFFPSSNPNSTDNFSVTIIFESIDKNNPITWAPIINQYNKSITLFSVLNSSLLLKGQNYGNLGFFISGINGINQYDDFYWQIYYLNAEKTWEYSAIGISSINISTEAFFRVIFSNQ